MPWNYECSRHRHERKLTYLARRYLVRVEQIMTQQVRSRSPDSTLPEAAQLTWDYDCGHLPAYPGDRTSRVVGVITDRHTRIPALPAYPLI
jgi:CBS domain-containing protein